MIKLIHFTKLLCVCLVTGLILILSGCWSAEELHDRAFARIMLLETAQDGIELTLGFPLPNRLASGKPGGAGGGGSDPPFTYVSKTGKDIGDAYRKIQSDIPRRITFGQLRNVVLGKKFIQAGVTPLLDFMAREPRVHINANLFATEGKVKDFTKIPVTFEQFPTDILTAYAETGVMVPVTVRDLLMSVYNGGDMVLSRLVFGRKGAVTEKNADKWMGTNGAFILKHGKMKGMLSTGETRAALWILGKLENAEFSVDSPSDGKPVDFLVWGARTDIKPKIIGNRIKFVIKCNAMARVLSTTSAMNLTDIENLNRMEKSLENKLADRIVSAVEKTQKMKTDAFQLGKYVDWHYPEQWKKLKPDWRDIYSSRVQAEPKVHIAIKWYGTAQKPEWNRLLPAEED